MVLIVLSPAGKIMSYMQVTKYSLWDRPTRSPSLPSILTSPSRKRPRVKTVTRGPEAVLYCFAHEPAGLGKFFGCLSVVGLLTLAAMAAFFIYLKVNGTYDIAADR